MDPKNKMFQHVVEQVEDAPDDGLTVCAVSLRSCDDPGKVRLHCRCSLGVCRLATLLDDGSLFLYVIDHPDGCPRPREKNGALKTKTMPTE